MELEKLEIIIEANTERIQQQLEPLMPYFEKVFNGIERVTGQSVSKAEKNMDIGDGVSNINKQSEQMTKAFEKQMEMMEKITSSSTNNIEKGLSKGFSTARKTVSKDVDALVKDINAKMGRAKAEQEKLAFLQTQRQSASSKGDTKNVVKYDSQIARAQEMMNKYQSSAKQMADSIRNEFKSLPHSLDAISSEMRKNESVIEGQKAKVRELTALYEQQAKKISRLQPKQLSNLYQKYGNTFDPGYQKEVKQAGFKFEDTKDSKKTNAEIARSNKEIQKLIAKNDSLQQSYSQAEDRTRSLRSAVKGLNTELGKSSIATGNAALGAKKIGQGAEKSKSLFSKFGGVFNRTSNNIAHGSKRMSSGMNSWGMSLKFLLPSLVVYQLLGTAIRNLATGFWSALKTNDEFNNSLNQIKVNLLTAFYPIYTAILPAVNALARGLAVVTGQIAHFTASLFGTTYTAAKAGAQGLYQNVQAMNDTGNSADKNREKVKKLQRSLMGFDEINRIGLQDDKDDDASLDNKNSVNFNTPVPDMPNWIGKANGLLRDFFKPFQDSWAKHGQTVINAWKYALGEVVGLAKSIGKSFMDVWTNGTGERFISNILLLVANLLNLVGDIAKAFRLAWDENDRGTKLIQAIFDMYNAFLELVNELVQSFRDAWNENGLGQSILGNILEIATNLIDAVGLIGQGLKNAWKEGGIGTSIFSTILGFVDDILGIINTASKSTKEWAKNLDFSPLLKSIDKLLKPIRKISKDVFEVLEWAYTNILLPLAKLVIEDVLPTFFNLLGNALEIVSAILEKVKPLFKWLLDKLIQPLINFTLGAVSDWLTFLGKFGQALEDLVNIDISSFDDVVAGFVQFGKDIWEGLKEGISSFGEGIGTFIKESMFDPIVNWFKELFGIHSPSTVFFEFGKFLIQGLTNGIKSLLSAPVELVKNLWDSMSGAVVTKGSVIWESSKKIWDDVSTKVKTKAGEAWTNTKTNWENIKKSTGDNFETARSWTTQKWDNITDKIKTKTTESWNKAKENWENIKRSTGDNFETARGWTSSKWNSIKESITNLSRASRDNASNAWSNLRERVGSFNENIRSNTNNAFNAVVKSSSDLGNRIGSGLSRGKQAVTNGAKTVANALKGFPMKAINAIKNGVGWVLGKLGAKNTMGEDYSGTKAYAQGTGYHPGGHALVNDGYGKNFREAYRLPNGQTGLFPNQRNLMVDLPAGSSVLSGPRTASMLGDTPAYANGVGSWFGKQWDKVKEFSGDVWDYVSEPSKLLEAGIQQTLCLKGALEPALSISKGAISTTANAATSFIKTKMDEFMDSGDGDTSPTGVMGVMQYLSNIASDVMSKFKGMTVTSGYRHGDPYSHGKRQAIDLAYPSNMNGSASYFAPANYVFDKFRNQVAYVITQGMVKDRSGMSGQNSGGNWVRWPDNDHYDHLHINGSIAQGQGSGPKGKGVERWRSSIRQAASRMRQSVTNSQVDGILAQIQLESGGNQAVTQSNAVWDVNTAAGNPAKGLLQYIPQTFNAFKMRGFENIYNGLHQLIAFFNNSNWRNDIQYGRSGWGPRGSRIYPYAQGTPYMPEDQIALLHKGEMVVPADFNPYNSANDFQTLQMPELFREAPQPASYVHVPDDRNIGGGMNGATEGIVNAVMMAMSMRNEESKPTGPTEIVLEVDGSVLGKVSIKEINKLTKQQGVSPIER